MQNDAVEIQLPLNWISLRLSPQSCWMPLEKHPILPWPLLLHLDKSMKNTSCHLKIVTQCPAHLSIYLVNDKFIKNLLQVITEFFFYLAKFVPPTIICAKLFGRKDIIWSILYQYWSCSNPVTMLYLGWRATSASTYNGTRIDVTTTGNNNTRHFNK